MLAQISTGIEKKGKNIYAVPTGISLTETNGERKYNFESTAFNSSSSQQDGAIWQTDLEFLVSFSKDLGSDTSGTEVVVETNIEKTSESTKTTGHTHHIDRDGGINLVAIGYNINEGDSWTDESAESLAVSLGLEVDKGKSDSATTNKGIDTGNFEFKFRLVSKQEKDGLVLSLELINQTPKICKGFMFTGIRSEENKELEIK
ncbi:MAG: hypothetical protein GY810_20505 [Aureispira sp.]|nr:hypothetical protein [Aureispira sp.]